MTCRSPCQDLEYALTESKAAWKIVVGHHPISSGCGHGNNTELEELLLPVLKALSHDIMFFSSPILDCLLVMVLQ
jgi:hypothetical protein